MIRAYHVFDFTPDPSKVPVHTLKKRLMIFPSPAGMSLTKLPLGGNNLVISGQGEFG
jgi:hypothetical protein